MAAAKRPLIIQWLFIVYPGFEDVAQARRGVEDGRVLMTTTLALPR